MSSATVKRAAAFLENKMQEVRASQERRMGQPIQTISLDFFETEEAYRRAPVHQNSPWPLAFHQAILRALRRSLSKKGFIVTFNKIA